MLSLSKHFLLFSAPCEFANRKIALSLAERRHPRLDGHYSQQVKTAATAAKEGFGTTLRKDIERNTYGRRRY